MATKKPSKIMFCHYNYPLVEELAEFNSGKLQAATYAVKLHNNVLYPNEGKLEDQFYFLNARIGGETHIITAAGQRDYPSNDPAIVAKLAAYLASKERQANGYNQKRGKIEVFDTQPYIKLGEQTFLKQKVIDEPTALKVCQELKLIYGDKVVAHKLKLDHKWFVRATSWYLTYERLKKAIDEILNS